MLVRGRIPFFRDALMQVPCSKAYIIIITLITFKMIHNTLNVGTDAGTQDFNCSFTIFLNLFICFLTKYGSFLLIKYGSFWCATVLLVNTKSDQHGLPIQKIGEAIALTIIAATEKHFTLSLN